LLLLPVVRWSLAVAAALAAALAGPPVRAETGPAPLGAPHAVRRTARLGVGRNLAGRGVSLRQLITPQSAVALSASTGPRKELPELRLMLGVQYCF
jgi:hypothetical protein